MPMRVPLMKYFLVPVALVIASCGGGGGGSSMTAAPATVSVLITDAPVAGYDQAIATITSVELIGNGAPVVLFSGSETIDLLRLRDFSELFAVSDTVPAGNYSKIRLHLSDLVLKRLDPVTGAVIETVEPQLVGNGKIDLNPRGPFHLAPGDVVFIELDFDMEKSLKITTTGSGKIIIRPVVFVDIRTHRLDGRLSRVHGVIRSIDEVAGTLELCQTAFVSHWDHEGDNDSASQLPASEERCLTVRTNETTGIFDAEGLPQDLAGLEVGEEATVIGRINRVEDDEQDAQAASDDSDLELEMTAAVIEEGPLGTYSRFHGRVVSTVDSLTDTFDFVLGPGQGFGTGTTLPVQLYEKSHIFNPRGEPLERDAIAPDRGALVDGVLVVGDQDLIRSPLVILAPVLPPEGVLKGEIISVDVGALTLIVNDGIVDRCVSAADAEVFLVNTDNGLSTTRGELADLQPGSKVAVFGTDAEGGCFTATTIIAED
jgi:hypothetical protein